MRRTTKAAGSAPPESVDQAAVIAAKQAQEVGARRARTSARSWRDRREPEKSVSSK